MNDPVLVSILFSVIRCPQPDDLHRFKQLFLYETRVQLDDIVGGHSFILFINWCGERPQLNRQLEYIPGTRIGVVCLHY